MSLPDDVHYEVKHLIDMEWQEVRRELRKLESRLRDTDDELERLRERVADLEGDD